MADFNPMTLSLTPGGDYPITMPASGGIWIANPAAPGGGFYEVQFPDGSTKYYHADGTIWTNFPN